MKEIVVLSGKGGTGKTSIAAALAFLAGDKAIIADADVDAANMHLLLQPAFGNKTEFFSGVLAAIDQEACDHCGLCVETCRFGAIIPENGQFKINKLDCEGCGYCARICPMKAINMHPRKSGYQYVSDTRIGNSLVHARLDAGAENSGKLVASVKKVARQLALDKNKDFVLVDGSPGIGCPVVSSLAGANYVVLVTESSLSGIHDLKRIHSLIDRFRIKTGCIINKNNLNPALSMEISNYLEENGIDHLADLPFDLSFTRAMVHGKTVIESNSPLRILFAKIWNKIQLQINNH